MKGCIARTKKENLMADDIYEFSKTRPLKKGKVIACVPYRFYLKTDAKGKRIAVPAGIPGSGEDHTKSGYLAFASEDELKKFLEELKMRFDKHDVKNFGDIMKSVGLSKTVLKTVSAITKNGKFSLRSAWRRGNDLVPVDVKDIKSLEGIDWFSLANSGSNGKGGVLRAWMKGESPDKAIQRLIVKDKENEITFGVPGDFLDMRGTLSLYEDMKKQFGPDNVERKTDFKAQTPAFVNVKLGKKDHVRREASSETK